MRTLVDLLNDERGYVRIYSDHEGFGYELATYVPRPTPDLFEQMSGYTCLGDASIAARYQLSAVQQLKRRARAKKIGQKPEQKPGKKRDRKSA
jgi:hypothetical protein